MYVFICVCADQEIRQSIVDMGFMNEILLNAKHSVPLIHPTSIETVAELPLSSKEGPSSRIAATTTPSISDIVVSDIQPINGIVYDQNIVSHFKDSKNTDMPLSSAPSSVEFRYTSTS